MSSVRRKLQQRTRKGRWAILSLPLPLQAIVIAFGWEVFSSQKNCNKEHGQEDFKIGNNELQKKHHPVQAMNDGYIYLESGSRERRKCCVESETRDRAISLICYIFRRSVQLFQSFVSVPHVLGTTWKSCPDLYVNRRKSWGMFFTFPPLSAFFSPVSSVMLEVEVIVELRVVFDASADACFEGLAFFWFRNRAISVPVTGTMWRSLLIAIS